MEEKAVDQNRLEEILECKLSRRELDLTKGALFIAKKALEKDAKKAHKIMHQLANEWGNELDKKVGEIEKLIQKYVEVGNASNG